MLASVAHATRWNMKLNTIWHGVYRACNALDAMQHLRPTDCIYIHPCGGYIHPCGGYIQPCDGYIHPGGGSTYPAWRALGLDQAWQTTRRSPSAHCVSFRQSQATRRVAVDGMVRSGVFSVSGWIRLDCILIPKDLYCTIR